jgi:hypothetical protein
VALPRGRSSASPGLGPYDAPPPCASPSCSSSPRKTPSRPSRLRSKSRAEHSGITLVGKEMVATWLPFGAYLRRSSGLAEWETPLNASECLRMPCSLANQGRNTFSIHVLLETRKDRGFIGTRARSVVAPTGFATLCSALPIRGEVHGRAA